MKFFRSADEHLYLISVDIFGLHTMHRAFQHGAKDSSWSVGKVLHAMWKI